MLDISPSCQLLQVHVPLSPSSPGVRVCKGGQRVWRALSTMQPCTGLHMTHPGNTQPFILISWKNKIDTTKPMFFFLPQNLTQAHLFLYYVFTIIFLTIKYG